MAINDFNFNPFDDTMLATANNDGNINVYKVPAGGLTADVTTPVASWKASDKR